MSVNWSMSNVNDGLIRKPFSGSRFGSSQPSIPFVVMHVPRHVPLSIKRGCMKTRVPSATSGQRLVTSRTKIFMQRIIK